MRASEPARQTCEPCEACEVDVRAMRGGLCRLCIPSEFTRSMALTYGLYTVFLVNAADQCHGKQNGVLHG